MAYELSERAIELTEPGFEAPPVFREAGERRLHLRGYHHWTSLQRGRSLPCVADLDPGRLGAVAPNSVLIMLDPVPTLAFVGARLRLEAGIGASPMPLADVPAGSVVAHLTDQMDEVIASASPARFEAEFVGDEGRAMLCRGVLMPLSNDGRTVDALFGVINWKELAGADLAGSLEAEIAHALAREPH